MTTKKDKHGSWSELIPSSPTLEWLEQEKAAWSWLCGNEPGGIPGIRDRFNPAWDELENTIASKGAPDISAVCERIFGGDKRILLSVSKEGRYLCRIAQRDVRLANAVAALILGMWPTTSTLDSIFNRHQQAGIMTFAAIIAWANFQEGLGGLETDLDIIRVSGKKLTQTLEEKVSTYDNAQVTIRAEGESFLKSSGEGLDKLVIRDVATFSTLQAGAPTRRRRGRRRPGRRRVAPTPAPSCDAGCPWHPGGLGEAWRRRGKRNVHNMAASRITCRFARLRQV